MAVDDDRGATRSRRLLRALLRRQANPRDDREDDPFAEQRDNVEAPMRRLFAAAGRRNQALLASGVLSGTVGRLFELLPPFLLGVAIDAVIFETKPFALPLVPAGRLPNEATAQFWVVAGLITASFLGASLAHWVRGWSLQRFAQNVQHRVRTDTYDRMQRLDLAFFDEKQTGELMSILSSDVNSLDQFLHAGLDQLTNLVISVGGIAVILLLLNPQLAVVTLLPVPVIAVLTYLFVRIIEPRYSQVRATLADLFSRLENNLAGIAVIKTSNTEDYERSRVEAASRELYDSSWRAISLAVVFFPAQRALAGAGFVLAFVAGGLWVLSPANPPLFFTGELTPGEFVTFVFMTQQFVGPVSQFGPVVDMYQRAKVAAERVFGLMDEADRRSDATPGSKPLDAVDDHVSYRDVTFGYGGEPIIDGVSFTADAHDDVALVGPSGSGKSTVVKLIPRLYEADEGDIFIDGDDIHELDVDSLRRSIGYVGQEPFLFYGTVRENLAYGAFGADDEDLLAAARAANADRFIRNLPNGYDTMVGSRGGKLSGGQRQRLSIARAILRDPEILVLDEATSAVDTETELLIQRALDRVTADRTTFTIAHRLSTVRDADRILVMDAGEIVERGTHTDLLEEDDLYARLWKVQVGQTDDLPPEFLDRLARQADRPAG